VGRLAIIAKRDPAQKNTQSELAHGFDGERLFVSIEARWMEDGLHPADYPENALAL